MAWTAIDIGWAIAATSPLRRRSSTLTQALAGTVVQLGEGAVTVEPDREVAGAEVGAPGPAVGAHAARHAGAGRDEVTLGEPADVAPGGDDGAGELVAGVIGPR